MRAHGAATIAITNDADSPLAHAADLAIDLCAGTERAIPGDEDRHRAVRCLRADRRGASARVPWQADEWETAVPAVDAVLHDPAPAQRAAVKIGDAAGAVVLARGFLFAVALETALKLKEMTALLAEGDSAADFLHGPIAVVDAALPVLAISAAGPCAADVADTVAEIRSRGGRVLIDRRRCRRAAAVRRGRPGGARRDPGNRSRSAAGARARAAPRPRPRRTRRAVEGHGNSLSGTARLP